jgi:hypothetical protein
MEPCGTAAYASGHHGRHPPAALAPAVPPGVRLVPVRDGPREERRLLLARHGLRLFADVEPIQPALSRDGRVYFAGIPAVI